MFSRFSRALARIDSIQANIPIVDLSVRSLGRLTELALEFRAPDALGALEGRDATITLFTESGEAALSLRVPLSSRTNLTAGDDGPTASLVLTEDLEGRGIHSWSASVSAGRKGATVASGAGVVTREWDGARLVA